MKKERIIMNNVESKIFKFMSKYNHSIKEIGCYISEKGYLLQKTLGSKKNIIIGNYQMQNYQGNFHTHPNKNEPLFSFQDIESFINDSNQIKYLGYKNRLFKIERNMIDKSLLLEYKIRLKTRYNFKVSLYRLMNSLNKQIIEILNPGKNSRQA